MEKHSIFEKVLFTLVFGFFLIALIVTFVTPAL